MDFPSFRTLILAVSFWTMTAFASASIFSGEENGFFCPGLFASADSDESRLFLAYDQALSQYRSQRSDADFARILTQRLSEGDYYSFPASEASLNSTSRFLGKIGKGLETGEIAGVDAVSFRARSKERLENLLKDLEASVRRVEVEVKKAEEIRQRVRDIPISRPDTTLGQISPDWGTAVLVNEPREGRHSISLWDLKSGTEKVSSIIVPDDDIFIEANPAFERVLSRGDDGRLYQWGLRPGSPDVSFEGHTKTVTDTKTRWDLDRLLSSAEDGRIILWELSTGKRIKSFAIEYDFIFSFAVDPEFKTAVGLSRKGKIVTWDIQRGTVLRSTDVLSGKGWKLRASPDLKRAIVASLSGEFVLWDLEAGKAIRRFQMKSGKGPSYAWEFEPNPEFTKAIVTDAATAQIYDFSKGRVKRLKARKDLIRSVHLSADGKTALVRTADRLITGVDMVTGEDLFQFDTGMPSSWSSTSSLAANDDFSKIITFDRIGYARVWDVDYVRNGL